MTLEEAFPLINASTELVTKLVTQIMDSAHMTDEQRKQALGLAVSNLEATAKKIKDARFEGPSSPSV